MFGEKIPTDKEQLEAGRIFVSPLPIEEGPEWNSAEIEGKLSVDVLETETDLVVIATMAGTRPEDIFLHLHNDFLTIRGSRSPNLNEPVHFFYEECYWGKFSRTIVLPVDVNGDIAKSEYRNGVLTIRLPKASARQSIPILVIED
ncbi:MAG: Hsp20/alpha crystallin family protein [Patescibacteria group bacterium]|jgi:HSP20 family protein